jgi:iron complex outermembrane recepter protein
MLTRILMRGVAASALTYAVVPSAAALAQQSLPPISIGAQTRGVADGKPNGKPRSGTRNVQRSSQPSVSGGDAGQGGAGTTAAASALTPQNSYVVPNASTATKTDTPVMNAPINVQAVTEKTLQDQQATTLAEALRNVSGITAPSGAAASSGERGGFIFVRGFATTDYYRDGFRVAPGVATIDVFSSRQLANVQSIEVLKGPAAILYGRSEPGGIINLTIKEPEATPHFGVGQQVGSLALYRSTFNATGPLTEDKSLLYRVDLSYENNGAPFGSFVNGATSENFFIAPTLKWNVSESTSFKAELEYNNDRSGVHSFITPRINGSFITVPRNIEFGVPNSSEHTPSVFAALSVSHKFDEDWSIKQRVAFNRLNYGGDPSVGPLQTFPAGSQNTLDLGIQQDGLATTYSTNLDIIGHVNSWGAKHTVLFGGDFYRTSSTANGYYNLPWLWGTGNIGFPWGFPTPITYLGKVILPFPPFAITIPLPPAATVSSVQRQDTKGLYVQDQIELPYGFHVLAGARFQHINQQSATATGSDSFYAGPPQLDGSPLTEARVTPRFGLLWRPQQWLSLYGNYTEGFSANKGVTYPGSLAPPSSAVSWEGGVKLELFDGRLRATADYYKLIKTNVPTTDANPLHKCGGSSCVLITGEGRSEGPELDVQGMLLPGWNVILNYTNQDVRVTKGDKSAGGTGQSGLTTGQRFPNVPRNLASLWSTYEFQDDVLKGLKIGAGYTYHGSQPILDQTGGIPGWLPLVASYGTVDLMAGYSYTINGFKTTAQVNVTNLLDKTYYTDASAAKPTVPWSLGAFRSYGAPLTVNGALRVEF